MSLRINRFTSAVAVSFLLHKTLLLLQQVSSQSEARRLLNMSVGFCSEEALPSHLKFLSIHSLYWARHHRYWCSNPSEIHMGKIRWAPYISVTSLYRWHCVLSRLLSTAFHQPVCHRPSNHIYHAPFLQEMALVQLKLFQTSGLPLPFLQTRFKPLFPGSIFQSLVQIFHPTSNPQHFVPQFCPQCWK